MINDRLLFHLVAGMMFLIFAARAYTIYSKRRTKYNLAMLVVVIVLFVLIVLDYVYPRSLKYVGGTPVQILLATISILSLLLFLFYPEMKGFLARRKMRDK
ncbi:MAG: hypothetical protein HYX87_06725 [Chloroflexi bacterium]|nr:hypothetical protein [Chloroflexota bacterium]